MRKISLLVLSIGALLALSFYWQGPATARDVQTTTASSPSDLPGENPEDCWGNWFFGLRIAGGWYDEIMHPGTPPWPGTAVVTFGADGSLTYKSVGPVGDQAGVGTWKRTGYRQITAELLLMGFQADEITGNAFGELVHSHSHQWTCRSIIVFDFDWDFQTATGTGCTDCFWPEQDPLGNEDPFFTLDDVVHTIRKVNLIPCTAP